MAKQKTIRIQEIEYVDRRTPESLDFVVVYDKYFPRIYNYVIYRCGELDVADEITSAVFEVVYRKWYSYKPEKGPLENWIFTIARNMVNSHFRREKIHRYFPLEIIDNFVSRTRTPEHEVLENEAHSELLQAIQKLDNRERDILGLKFNARFTNRRIAALTHLSESNIGVIIYRALKKLRKELGE